MFIILVIAFILILCGILLLIFLSRNKKDFGILAEHKHIYKDTEKLPGKTLYATSLPLVGKPDYLLADGKYIIPVEVKTGTAPRTQYVNHNMQLMAYCLLVEENYGVRPPGGYIKYLDKELKLQYTKEAEESVRAITKEILQNKKSNKEFYCNHPQHNK